MKTTKFLPVLFLLLLPFLASAQDFVGSWTMPDKAPDGTAVTNTISFAADGKMTIDFASDGKIDVNMTYTYTDGVVTINDTSKESPCSGKIGKYKMTVAGDTCTATLIEDACEQRRVEKRVMTRK